MTIMTTAPQTIDH